MDKQLPADTERCCSTWCDRCMSHCSGPPHYDEFTELEPLWVIVRDVLLATLLLGPVIAAPWLLGIGACWLIERAG